MGGAAGPVEGFGFRVSGFGCGVSGFGFRGPEFWFRISGFVFRVFRVSCCFVFRVSRFGFEVSDARFQFSDSRFRVDCFGMREGRNLGGGVTVVPLIRNYSPPRTLQWAYAWGHMVVLGEGAVSDERGTPV